MSGLVHGHAQSPPPTPVWQHAGGAVAARLDTRRWHFQQGPIDIILGADGPEADVNAAMQQAWQCFIKILPGLVSDLAFLRKPLGVSNPAPAAVCLPQAGASGQTAALQQVQSDASRRMVGACLPYGAHVYITPMAAVAGAVSDTLIRVLADCPGLQRAYANNGGDIALHLAQDAEYRVGLFADVTQATGPLAHAQQLDGMFTVGSGSSVRGVATSGWQGRSFSLGIADSVTVLARNAAQADAAATVVANQVTADHPAVQRAPAQSLKDDTDLAGAQVTVAVGVLPSDIVGQALDRGERQARALIQAGLIAGAALVLQGQTRSVLPDNFS